jgi:type I restriction enzyme, S subunit
MSELPKGWELTEIREVAEYVQRGKSPKYIDKSDLPVINQKCVRWSGIDQRYLKFIHPDQWSAWSSERFLQSGDLLWNSTGTGTIGRAALFTKLEGYQRSVVDSHVTIVRCHKICLPSYLHYFVRSPLIQRRIEEMHTGSTNQVELSREEVLRTSLPLPPLNEQRRIVAKLDSLFARSRRAREELERVSGLCDRYRQAVLTAALDGHLTHDWREQNPTLEKSNGSHSDKSIPNNWYWVKVEDIGEVFLGRQRSPKNHNGSNMKPYVRAANITWNGWDLSDIKEMNFDDRDFKKYKLKSGDVLINEGSGSAGEVGKPAIWNDAIENCCFQNTLICVRPFTSMSQYSGS